MIKLLRYMSGIPSLKSGHESVLPTLNYLNCNFQSCPFFFTATIFAQVGNTGHKITLLAYDSSNLNFYLYSIHFKSSHKFPRTNFRDKNHLPTSKLVSEAFRQEFGDSDRFAEIDEGELLVTM